MLSNFLASIFLFFLESSKGFFLKETGSREGKLKQLLVHSVGQIFELWANF